MGGVVFFGDTVGLVEGVLVGNTVGFGVGI